MGRLVRPYGRTMGDDGNCLRSPRCPRRLLLILGAALILSACGDSTKRELGLGSTPSDEIAVIRRAPLSQPPDFKQRPPRPGAKQSGVATPPAEDRQTVFGTDKAAAKAASAPAPRQEGPATTAAPQGEVNQLSPGESAFLTRAGAESIDPDIRNKVNRETAVLATVDSKFIQRLLNFDSDPAEAQRLRENQALGRKPNEGDTPLIERKSDQLFDVF